MRDSGHHKFSEIKGTPESNFHNVEAIRITPEVHNGTLVSPFGFWEILKAQENYYGYKNH